jgi:glycosyltransferase involved in cell wall biosynthesis
MISSRSLSLRCRRHSPRHKVKINLVLPHQLAFPPIRGGGVENLNWLLAREYARVGHQVVAYSRVTSGLSARETDEHGIRHVRIKGYNRRPNRWLDHLLAFRYERNLARIIEVADITSSHTPFSFLLRRIPRIGVCTHTIHRTPKWQVRLYRRMERLYCGSDAVVAQARAIDPGLTNLKRVYNCVEVNKEPPHRAPGLGKGLQFLYVGRFVPDKGIESLVQGFEASLREFPDNRLVTVGPQRSHEDGDSRFFRRMSRYIQIHKLHESIEFLPAEFDRTKLKVLVEQANVVCVPSLSGETFSMAILEALGLGKPVLVSDFGPMKEAVDHMETGYVASAGSSVSLAEGIRFFSQNSETLPSIGRAGLEKARTCFSVEQIAAEYLADFEALMGLRTTNAAREPCRA